MAIERTLILIKPDGVARALVGEIIHRFERKGLRIVGLKCLRFDSALARRHYAQHVGKPFYAGLESFITSGPVVAMALEGHDAVANARALMGATYCHDALAGSIRGDYASQTTQNLVHGSDSPEHAAEELARFFNPDELL